MLVLLNQCIIDTRYIFFPKEDRNKTTNSPYKPKREKGHQIYKLDQEKKDEINHRYIMP